MAIVTFSKKRFEKDFGKLTEKLQHEISMFGTPIEAVKDNEISIEVFPNRPDLLSYQGFKRSFLAYMGKQKGLKKYKLNKPQKDYKVTIESSVKLIRPFTACAIIKGLKLDDEKIKELIEIQEKLHNTIGRKRKKVAIGIYPLEKINLPIIYKTIEPDKIKFQPLESDREMTGLEILQRHPTGREYAPLLSGKSKFPIFIDSNKNILSMPPIINSELTGRITEYTKDVFIEVSGFDFKIQKKALSILVSTLSDMEGKIYQMTLNYKHGNLKKQTTPDLKPEKNKISIENTNKLLGLNLNESAVKSYLERMGHNYSKSVVETPSWRTDILHEVDLIEDIAIAYGYDNLVPEIPEISTIGQEDPKAALVKKMSQILAGLNLIELSNYHLTNSKDQYINMGILEKQIKKLKNLIEVEQSKTDYTLLRNNLSHYALKILSENIDSEYPQNTFEIGTIFELKDSKVIEKESLSIALTPGNFTELKQIIENFFKMMGLKAKIKEPSLEIPKNFIEGRTAEINFKNKPIGFFGEIHPRILKNWKIKMPVSLCEVDLNGILGELLND